jgi:hypothetical protein
MPTVWQKHSTSQGTQNIGKDFKLYREKKGIKKEKCKQ